MKTSFAALIVLALASAACSSGQSAPTPAVSSPTEAATATITATATPVANQAASPLEGTWATAPTTCEQQNAALTKAGFTAEQLELGEWDDATCMDMAHGSVQMVRLQGGRLVLFEDGAVGWDGSYEVVNGTTFRAGDLGAEAYITYKYSIDGDRLVIDMVQDDIPGVSEAELWGERIAQTVIYESAPFMRQP